MRTTTTVFLSAVIASFVAGAATAQTTTFDREGAAEDAFTDLTDDIEDDADRDLEPFGNLGRQVGFDGSFALRGSASAGNTESASVGLGANLGYYDGANGYRLTMTYSYGEEGGVKDEDRLLYGLEYTRDFGDRFYGYGQIQGSQDEFASFVEDTFVGAGVGYRVIDTNREQWSVSGGPGYRWATLSDDSEIEEVALSLTSNYSTRLTDTVLFSMDTSVIHSESDTVLYNDAGVNVAMSNSLALRTSLVTETHSDPLPGDEATDYTLGVSLIYSFN